MQTSAGHVLDSKHAHLSSGTSDSLDRGQSLRNQQVPVNGVNRGLDRQRWAHKGARLLLFQRRLPHRQLLNWLMYKLCYYTSAKCTWKLANRQDTIACAVLGSSTRTSSWKHCRKFTRPSTGSSAPATNGHSVRFELAEASSKSRR